MTDLYPRLLLWHKLVAMQTGGMALCSVKRKLNRDKFRGWATVLRNVADEIDAFLRDGLFILDDRGQRMYPATVERASLSADTEAQHVTGANPQTPDTRAASRKAGGLCVAKRKPT